jgi:hypothetical protein
MAHPAEETVFEDELPTRASGTVLRAYARETEELLARGEDPSDAFALITRIPDPPDPELDPRLDGIARLLVSGDDLAWFALGGASAALAAAVDDRTPLRAVVARAELPLATGLENADILIAMGVLVVEHAVTGE